MTTATTPLPDGLVAVVKHDCPTCGMVGPVLDSLGVHVVSEDDDEGLALSYQLGVETVPTLMTVRGGRETARVVGWSRSQWESLTGSAGLAPELPDARPGCGSRTLDPTVADELAVRFEGHRMQSRRVEISALEDEAEALFDRGWTDGLPVVAPTEARVLRMLAGTTRDPQEVVAVVPPDLAECTVEKAAVNAVMAGCRPEYLPVVLAAVEAACTDAFNAHGVLATTMPVGPVLVVNGPVRRRIGMNSGINAMGQGNRANSTIGRALQLVIRNVGGGKPGEIDRATQGNPGKVAFCFAEDEEGSPFEPLHVARGFGAETSTVTVFAGEGPRGVVDQLSRDPESLVRSLAACLATVQHPKLPLAFDAIVVLGPEHGRVFREAGWDRATLLARLHELTLLRRDDFVRGAGGMAEGVQETVQVEALPKFRTGGILVVHAGGGAGLFSSIIGGWANGTMGSEPVTREVMT
ncbi:MAG TPA: thioredoxin family protein [Acidimicrobiales bacterium]|nr:thioredoxin family protein [Acidimicrobiales bacterium]